MFLILPKIAIAVADIHHVKVENASILVVCHNGYSYREGCSTEEQAGVLYRSYMASINKTR